MRTSDLLRSEIECGIVSFVWLVASFDAHQSLIVSRSHAYDCYCAMLFPWIIHHSMVKKWMFTGSLADIIGILMSFSIVSEYKEPKTTSTVSSWMRSLHHLLQLYELIYSHINFLVSLICCCPDAFYVILFFSHLKADWKATIAKIGCSN